MGRRENMEDTATPRSAVESRIVYVRGVDAADLPEAARAAAPAGALYAIHDESGARLAVVAGRELAFSVARQHEMTPVSVH
jgi:hypothetical protein